MKVKIHEFADHEFNEAIEWYEMQKEGLGATFKKSAIHQVKRIQQNPTWFLKEDDFLFKIYIPKFPYKIVYTIEKNQIVIWAFAHLHRKPFYWRDRVR